MILPDANLLIHSINTRSPDHQAAFSWWKGLLDRGEQVGLCAPVVFAFIRLTTGTRVLASPLPVAEAFAYVNNWLEFSSVLWIEPGPGYLPVVQSLLCHAGTGGNLVTDAQIAAVALHHDATVHTADMDFSRFAAVRWKNPLLKG